MENCEDDSGQGLSQALATIWSFVPFRSLEVAIKVELIDFLEKSAKTDLESIAFSFGWSNRGAKALLRVLEHSGLVHFVRESGTWLPTDISRKWFLKSSDEYLGDLVDRTSRLCESYSSLLEVLETDKPEKHMLDETKAAFGGDKETTISFSRMMSAMTREIIRKALVQINIAQPKKVLDIGGGNAALCVELASHYPNACFDIVELPGVAELAQVNVLDTGYQDRIRVHEQDWSTWRNQSNYDLVVLSHILHEEPLSEAERLFDLGAANLLSDGELWVLGYFGNGSGLQDFLERVFTQNMLVELGSDNPGVQWLQEQAGRNCLVECGTHALSGGRTLWRCKRT